MVVLAALVALVGSSYSVYRPADLQTELESWRTHYGTSWEVILDEETGNVRLLLNGITSAGPAPQSTQDWFALGRTSAERAQGLFAINPVSLVEERVRLLPLGIVGTTDKEVVTFTQKLSGRRVLGKWLTVLFDTGAHLLCIDADALTNIGSFDASPTVSSETAKALARQRFLTDTGIATSITSVPELAILPKVVLSQETPILIWLVEVYGDPNNIQYDAYSYCINAQTSVVESSKRLIYEAFQQQTAISGTIQANATHGAPDWPPDSGVDDPMNPNWGIVPMPYQYLQKSVNGKYSIITTSNFAGTFSFAAKFPTTVYLLLQGPYVTISSYGNDLLFQQTLSIGSNQVLLNQTYNESTVAQVNAFYRIGQMREWMYNINPLDNTFDGGAPYKARPNRPNQPDCNSAFDGQEVWFPKKTFGGCDHNMAFARTIWHEMGHWMTDRYGHLVGRGGAVQEAYNEGVADVWSTYIADYPCVGLGSQARCGTDTVDAASFCPCRNGHDGGRPLMAATWRVRERLKEQYQDNELGAAIANSLFLAWMNFTKVAKIRGYIQHEWLVLDDNDGILTTNQTPNFGAITGGFLDRQFPAFSLPYTEPTDCPSPPCPQ